MPQSNPPGKKQLLKYRPRWAVIVECEDERAHKKLHGRLSKMGLRPRLVRV